MDTEQLDAIAKIIDCGPFADENEGGVCSCAQCREIRAMGREILRNKARSILEMIKERPR